MEDEHALYKQTMTEFVGSLPGDISQRTKQWEGRDLHRKEYTGMKTKAPAEKQNTSNLHMVQVSFTGLLTTTVSEQTELFYVENEDTWLPIFPEWATEYSEQYIGKTSSPHHFSEVLIIPSEFFL